MRSKVINLIEEKINFECEKYSSYKSKVKYMDEAHKEMLKNKFSTFIKTDYNELMKKKFNHSTFQLNEFVPKYSEKKFLNPKPEFLTKTPEKTNFVKEICKHLTKEEIMEVNFIFLCFL